MGRVLIALITIVAGLVGAGALYASRTPAPAPAQVVVEAPAAPAPPAAPAVATASVLVTAHAVRAGSLLQPDDMAAEVVRQDRLPPAAITDSPETRTTLRGAMVRTSLDAGMPITGVDVLRPGDRGFLAAVLAPGMRAVSIQVDAVSGSAGLIWPGDRVDLVLTQTMDDPTLPRSRRLVAEKVLEDLRVIATDQQLVQEGQPNQAMPAMPTSRVLTLEVGGTGPERVAVAAHLGHLSAIVRAATPEPFVESPGQAEPHTLTWAGDVSLALAVDHTHDAIRIYRATEQATVSVPAPAK